MKEKKFLKKKREQQRDATQQSNLELHDQKTINQVRRKKKHELRANASKGKGLLPCKPYHQYGEAVGTTKKLQREEEKQRREEDEPKGKSTRKQSKG
jgi:hypothetical protein